VANVYVSNCKGKSCEKHMIETSLEFGLHFGHLDFKNFSMV
jgi:hypothetical protein